MFFYFFIALLIVQRLGELQVAKRNYKWAFAQGGLELGREHYKWMWALHSLFFAAMLTEYMLLHPTMPTWAIYPLIFFIAAQGLRIWAILSLGSYWNTRIVVIPGTLLQTKGPYRWIRHPNYLAVIVEIASIPLLFGLYITATLFTLLNAIVLMHRIRIEEEGLALHTSYMETMQKTPRWIPRRKK